MKQILIFIMVAIITNIYQLNAQNSTEKYLVVNDDYVNLRIEPDINSPNVEIKKENRLGQLITQKVQLRITDVVKVLKKNDKKVIIKNMIGNWVYVSLQRDNSIKGWVFDYYLSYPEEFVELRNLNSNMILEWPEDVEGCSFTIFSDGSFYKWKKERKGKLYIDKKRKIVIPLYDYEILKEKDIEGIINKVLFNWREVLFFNSEGKLCILKGEPPTYTTCAKIIQKK